MLSSQADRLLNSCLFVHSPPSIGILPQCPDAVIEPPPIRKCNLCDRQTGRIQV
jgi:hypothetical protein